MKTAIVGNGVGGGYLYRLLKQRFPEDEIEVFGKKNGTSCLIRPCGWLINYPLFLKLGEEANIDFDRYVMKRFNRMILQSKEIPSDVASIDKPLLIQGLFKGVRVKYSKPDISQYDRVIDATGKRVFLPKRDERLLVKVYQARCEGNVKEFPEAIVDNFHGLGYLIPLGNNSTHIGYGSIKDNNSKEILALLAGRTILCSCTSELWMGGPIFPVTFGKFCGIGESIGLVDPLSGVGIIPAMFSARALVDYWYDLKGYEEYIKHTYGYLSRGAIVLRSNNPVVKAFNLILSCRESSKLAGFNVGILGLISLIRLAYKSGELRHHDRLDEVD